jgi:hypothetical protein
MENTNTNTREIGVLTNIRDLIEKMDKFNQIEILRIFSKHSEVVLNENKNGIYVNLTEVSDNVIDEVIKHLDFVLVQESHLKKDENVKENYKNIYFGKDNKDNLLYNSSFTN